MPDTHLRVLRVIGYPPLPPSYDMEQGISCGAHTDYGCLTFLLADDFPGALQGRLDPLSGDHRAHSKSRRRMARGYRRIPFRERSW